MSYRRLTSDFDGVLNDLTHMLGPPVENVPKADFLI